MGYDDAGMPYEEYVEQEKAEHKEESNNRHAFMVYLVVFSITFGISFLFGGWRWYYLPLPILVSWRLEKIIKNRS